MKKLLKKVLAVAATFAMILTMGAIPASAAGTGSITINPPTGTPSATTNTYHIFKVFRADGNGTSISYKLLDGKKTSDAAWTSSQMGTYFDVDGAGNVTANPAAKDADGNLTAGAVAAIGTYVTAAGLTSVADPTSTGTSPAIANDLENGYYYITTSTGTAVTVNSTNPSVEVDDKNSVPQVDKKITGVTDGSYDEDGKAAIAQVGTTVSYKSEITVTGNTKNLKFTDTPGTGLSLDTSTLKVQVGGTDVAITNYKNDSTDTGINITFEDSYISTLSANTKIVITYNAIITNDALTITKEEGQNTASISYGDNNAKVTVENKPTVYNATVKVNKTFQGLANDASLANNDFAQFVLAKIVTDQDTSTTYTVYYAQNEDTKAVSWVNTVEDATKVTITKNGNGDRAFTGLADGTYTLIESKVPSGYNKATDTEVTILKGNVTENNLSQTKDIVNRTGSALPSTGGMGTTIFYALGAALAIGAGVILVTRKRLSK